MTTVRFDLTMEQEEKDIFSRAAVVMGITMASFMRTAAKEKASKLLESEVRITMTNRDFDAFTSALNAPFTPNIALQNALDTARKVKRV